MAQRRKAKRSQADERESAIVHRELVFDPGQTQETAFSRADLVFEGVDHARDSYEVRVFLNNKSANEKTARSPETGYAGRFVVFGHSRCFGEQDHCAPEIAATPPTQAIDPSGGHQHSEEPPFRGRRLHDVLDHADVEFQEVWRDLGELKDALAHAEVVEGQAHSEGIQLLLELGDRSPARGTVVELGCRARVQTDGSCALCFRDAPR